MPTAAPLPLAGMRVIDMSDGRAELCGRFLGDLGADVVLVEPPGGASSRHLPPSPAGVGVHFATHHHNKRGVALDLADPVGRAALLDLLGGADVWVESMRPASLAALGLAPAEVLARFPHLVIVAVTDFGQDGPYSAYAATDPVHLALGAVICRSGLPGLPPLVPPGSLAYDSSALHAAWAAMVGYWNRKETGHGDVLDVSVLEATVQVLDPVLGTVGTARAGASGLDVERGRPSRAAYPIYPCRDGHVRLVVLATRQWRSLRSWLGDPPELDDPALDTVAGRNARPDLIASYVTARFATLSVAEVVAEGQSRGVPLAPVLSLGDALRGDHYLERAALVDAEIAPGVTARIPSGLVEVGGVRAGFHRRAPALGEHTAEVLSEVRAAIAAPGTPPAPRRPFEGVRVLDLGIIVMGAETSRLFADLGAEVIKVENRAYPDGARAAIEGRMSASFAAGQRNKLAVGINLRTPEGVAILKRLAAVSDVVLENFKPGTLDSLGIGWEALRAVNPRLVMGSSSAMGSSGPWSTWLGYGPLVRSATALTSLWSYPQHDGSFSDGVTIIPDHLAARVVATAALAALIRTRLTGESIRVESAQAETILALLADLLVSESLAPGSGSPNGQLEQSVPWGVFPCAGEDEWCVVTVRDDEDWRRLTSVLGEPSQLHKATYGSDPARRADRAQLETWLAAWTQGRSPREVMTVLQGVGVPAAAMLRPGDLLTDPHLLARGVFRVLDQPWLPAPVPTENGPFRSRLIPDPELKPAPLLGQHTRDVCERVLGMEPTEVEALIAAGVLEEDVP